MQQEETGVGECELGPMGSEEADVEQTRRRCNSSTKFQHPLNIVIPIPSQIMVEH